MIPITTGVAAAAFTAITVELPGSWGERMEKKKEKMRDFHTPCLSIRSFLYHFEPEQENFSWSSVYTSTHC